jgi:hypothetical protein
MTIEKIGRRNNVVTGQFRPPRFIAFGLNDGVPFRRAYRIYPKKLEANPRVSHLTVVSAQ